MGKSKWCEKIVQIKEIEKLLEDYDVEIDSPDGWVQVDQFVDKGFWEGFEVVCDGKIVICNENHLFETKDGWKFAKFLTNSDTILTNSGEYKGIEVKKTNKLHHIVDIQVDHPNHRYYTNGLSSHNTNVGKSIFLSDCAANWLIKGYNVLYITLEMEEKDGIARRVDANLMDLTMEELAEVSIEMFNKKAERIRKMTTGRFWIKELPESSTTALNIETIITDILSKQKVKIDILVLDYLNLVGSYRIKDHSNSYIYLTKVSEEVRALAKKYNVPCLSAVQFNRKNGEDNSDPDFGDIGDSHGISKTTDLLLGLSLPEELQNLGQILVTLMKSRYGNKKLKRFLLGLEVDKMKFYDVEQFAQNDIMKEDTKVIVANQSNKINNRKVKDNSKLAEVNF